MTGRSIKPEEFNDGHFECFGQSVQGFDGEIRVARFDLLEISVVESEILHLLLRQFRSLSQNLYSLSHKTH